MDTISISCTYNFLNNNNALLDGVISKSYARFQLLLPVLLLHGIDILKILVSAVPHVIDFLVSPGFTPRLTDNTNASESPESSH